MKIAVEQPVIARQFLALGDIARRHVMALDRSLDVDAGCIGIVGVIYEAGIVEAIDVKPARAMDVGVGLNRRTRDIWKRCDLLKCEKLVETRHEAPRYSARFDGLGSNNSVPSIGLCPRRVFTSSMGVASPGMAAAGASVIVRRTVRVECRGSSAIRPAAQRAFGWRVTRSAIRPAA